MTDGELHLAIEDVDEFLAVMGDGVTFDLALARFEEEDLDALAAEGGGERKDGVTVLGLGHAPAGLLGRGENRGLVVGFREQRQHGNAQGRGQLDHGRHRRHDIALFNFADQGLGESGRIRELLLGAVLLPPQTAHAFADRGSLNGLGHDWRRCRSFLRGNPAFTQTAPTPPRIS